MSTITEIQAAIGQLPPNEKSVLAVWFQSQEDAQMSEAEETALLASLDKAAAQLDAGEGIPIHLCAKIPAWVAHASRVLAMASRDREL